MSLTRDQLFAKARQMALSAPYPTSEREQLRILALRRRYGRTKIKAEADRSAVESPKRYAWQDYHQ